MDFEPSSEARELAGLTRDLAASGRPLWPALAEAGVLTAALPKQAGGEGYGLPEQAAILTELGRHAATVPYLTSIVVAASTLARFDPSFVYSGAAALAVAHNGQVHGIVPDPAAVLVPAGAGLYLVHRPDIEPQIVEGGPGTGLLRSTLPDEPTIADPAFMHARLTVGTAAYQLGVVERALEMTAEYARTRIQFGRPIGSFQAVSQRLADAYIDVEALRVALWQAVVLLDADQPAAAEVATAGFWAVEAGHRVLHTAVHVHGGVGIDLEYPLHRYFLAAKYHEFLLGGATAQLLALSEVL
ncbi:acyl-CoA dehydrogenase family protein [Actinoplanes aureus]|uniref:Acyl-CoA dehydrogenase family protein n=1 Tax=Actinoplanes aureus TaxID=2792083 RepID=A0A931CAD5_9ACTN|nr:acyl-CoA dehydrogenase family protein [Actinoplanes aureus]MBG0565084.1 acyl-CoA dehydrogenase family protein [Actinoplanes aureus]